MAKPTIYDIAKAANVSKSTVSRVLNKSDSISGEKKTKVLKAIEELNFQPSKIARGMSSGFDAILVVLRSTRTTQHNPYFSEILHVISRYTEEENYDVIIQTSRNGEEELEKCMSKISNRIVRGIIMLSSPVDEFAFEKLDAYNVPIVVIGKVDGNYQHVCSVDTNNYQDSYELVSDMIKNGHTDIACLYSPQEYHVSIDRLEGYKQAMKDHHLPLKKEQIINSGYTMNDAYQASQYLFDQSPVPSAIFATDDLKLMSLYKVMKENSHKVPDDILIGGYSNSDMATFLIPDMMQIQNPTEALGKRATKMLFENIHQSESTARSVIIPTEKNFR